jgi:hypothetical protein
MIPDFLAALPEGSTAEVLVLDLTLTQARDYLPAQSHLWEATELGVRYGFRLTADQYWQLTVAEHAAMVAFLGLETG